MITNLEYKGKWKLPDTDDWFDGILTFDPTLGAQLEIFGTFNQTFWNKTNKDVIIGETTSGKITLIDNWYRTANHVHNGVTIEIYRPGFIFEGRHFERISDLKFTKVNCELFNLFQWLEATGLNYKTDFDGSHYSISYDKVEEIYFNLNSICKGKISFKSPHFTNGLYNKIELKEQAYFILDYQEEVHFQEILLDLSCLNDFITFLSFGQSYPMSISFNDSKYERKYHYQPIENYINCYYHNVLFNNSYKLRDTHEHLVKYSEIKEIFPVIIEKWFELHKKYFPVFKLMLNSFRDIYNFSIDKFMDNIRALESYHRNTHNNERIPEQKYNELVESILSKVELEKDNLEWLKNRLKGNEPSLNKRLKELLIENQNLFTKKYVDSEKQSKIIKSTVDSRNYYTHYDKSLKDKALTGKELFNTYTIIKGLLYSCVLKDIGLDNSHFENGLLYNLYI